MAVSILLRVPIPDLKGHHGNVEETFHNIWNFTGSNHQSKKANCRTKARCQLLSFLLQVLSTHACFLVAHVFIPNAIPTASAQRPLILIWRPCMHTDQKWKDCAMRMNTYLFRDSAIETAAQVTSS